MHRQVQKQNCFQLSPALIVVFIVTGHEWQQRENGEPMNFFFFIQFEQNNAGSTYFP